MTGNIFKFGILLSGMAVLEASEGASRSLLRADREARVAGSSQWSCRERLTLPGQWAVRMADTNQRGMNARSGWSGLMGCIPEVQRSGQGGLNQILRLALPPLF